MIIYVNFPIIRQCCISDRKVFWNLLQWRNVHKCLFSVFCVKNIKTCWSLEWAYCLVDLQLISSDNNVFLLKNRLFYCFFLKSLLPDTNKVTSVLLRLASFFLVNKRVFLAFWLMAPLYSCLFRWFFLEKFKMAAWKVRRTIAPQTTNSLKI